MAEFQKHNPLVDPIPTSDNVDAVPSYKESDPLVPVYKEKDPLATSGRSTSGTNPSSVSQAVTDGPVAQNVKAAYGNTVSDFNSLSESKVTPETRAATGQQLTTYHSFFYNLLTWKNPRATAITFVGNIALIFIARYLPLINWLFKALAIVFGTTVAAELAGKPFGGNGFTSAFRPKKYVTLPREAVDNFLSELHELLNFFVLEFQRILFVENIPLTAAASITAAIALGLIQIVPLWGLTLIGTTVVYLVPLVYFQNKEFIDAQLNHASKVVETQTAQVKDLTVQQTARATEAARGYATDISTKASELVGQARTSVSGPSGQATGSSTGSSTGSTTGASTGSSTGATSRAPTGASSSAPSYSTTAPSGPTNGAPKSFTNGASTGVNSGAPLKVHAVPVTVVDPLKVNSVPTSVPASGVPPTTRVQL